MRHERLAGAVVDAALDRALLAAARDTGLAMTIVAHASRGWASATFAGARHELVLSAPPAPGLESWLAALPETELAVRGHLVADLAVEQIEADGAAVAATLAVLTIEEG